MLCQESFFAALPKLQKKEDENNKEGPNKDAEEGGEKNRQEKMEGEEAREGLNENKVKVALKLGHSCW